MDVLVVGGMKRGGGISEFIKTIYNELSKNPAYNINVVIESGINEFGNELDSRIKCYYVTPMKKNPLKYFLDWKHVLQKIHYDVAHIHTDNFVRFAPYYLLDPSKTIIHSHNSYNMEVSSNKIKRLIHEHVKKKIKLQKYTLVACSDSAAKWLFDDRPYIWIKNGIHTDKYKYQDQYRIDIRERLKVKNNETLFGNIGRFTFQKNHAKLIRIFSELCKKNPNIKLVLIGKGELEKEIEKQIHQLKLDDKVIILGYVSDVEKYLSAMDVVIFPSNFEGFPLSLVEAQASGLQIFYSDAITKEIEITDHICSFSNKLPDSEIAETISHISLNSLTNRADDYTVVREAGFDIQNTINAVDCLYRRK